MSSGTEKRVRNSILPIRLSAEERALVEAAAAAADGGKGLTLSSYVRQRLLDGPIPRQVRRPPADRKELVRLLGELGKIGSNLNQLAKGNNQGLLVYGNEVETACRAVDELKVEILRALGRLP